MSKREFMKQFRRLARKGWRRRNDDSQVFLKRPRTRNHPNNFSYSPASAVYFQLTGRRVGWNETSTLSRGLNMKWETVKLFENVAAYPNFDPPINCWEWDLKERLMKLIPVC